MKIRKTPSGKTMIQATLGALKVGETWKIDPAAYSIRYLRVSVSLYSSAVNKSFTVNAANPEIKNDKIKITRTR